jgi:hypothetical protein
MSLNPLQTRWPNGFGGAAEGADADAGANLDRDGEQRLWATVARFISGRI